MNTTAFLASAILLAGSGVGAEELAAIDGWSSDKPHA
jgi:hypothetical protein